MLAEEYIFLDISLITRISIPLGFRRYFLLFVGFLSKRGALQNGITFPDPDIWVLTTGLP
jgi:hypothetical protein